MAADSRGTFGDPRGVTAQNDNMNKTRIVADRFGLMMAGSAEFGASILLSADRARVGADTPPAEISDFVGRMAEESRNAYRQWFSTVPVIVGQGQPGRPDLIWIAGGYERSSEGNTVPRLFQMSSVFDFAPQVSDYGWTVAGVPQYALYLLNRLYQPDKSVAELAALAVYAITETAGQDGKVGGPVKVLKIPADSSEKARRLSDEEVAEIVSRNQHRSDALRTSFYATTSS